MDENMFRDAVSAYTVELWDFVSIASNNDKNARVLFSVLEALHNAEEFEVAYELVQLIYKFTFMDIRI